MSIVYKACAAAHWQAAQHDGVLRGTADDLRDGYIHLSTAAQLEETVVRHYAGQNDLVVIAVDVVALGSALRWERSRDGALFPHLYGELPLSAMLWAKPLPLGAEGRHVLPAL